MITENDILGSRRHASDKHECDPGKPLLVSVIHDHLHLAVSDFCWVHVQLLVTKPLEIGLKIFTEQLQSRVELGWLHLFDLPVLLDISIYIHGEPLLFHWQWVFSLYLLRDVKSLLLFLLFLEFFLHGFHLILLCSFLNFLEFHFPFFARHFADLFCLVSHSLLFFLLSSLDLFDPLLCLLLLLWL